MFTATAKTGADSYAPHECILDGPTEHDGVCTLRGVDAQRILEQEFGVAYSLHGVYELMHRPRKSDPPAHERGRPSGGRKSDPEAQQRWLDRAPLLSSKSAMSTPTRRSRSGSRTSPEIARVGHSGGKVG